MGDLVAPPHGMASRPRVVRGEGGGGAGAGGRAGDDSTKLLNDRRDDAEVGGGEVARRGGEGRKCPSSFTLAQAEIAREETADLLAFEISHVGPIFGGGMRTAGGVPGLIEAEVWHSYAPDVPLPTLKRSVLGGSRRVNRLPVRSDTAQRLTVISVVAA